MTIILSEYVISEHEPRKGTETIQQLIENLNQFLIISEHEPRKGTETNLGFDHRIRIDTISEHEPRKGTETPVSKS